jgi:hypothetical protein
MALWDEIERGGGVSCLACGGAAGRRVAGVSAMPEWHCEACGSALC